MDTDEQHRDGIFTFDMEMLPAETSLRQHCIVGDRCDFTKLILSGNKSEQHNTIRPMFLRYLLLGGCEQTVVHRRGVRLKGARILCEQRRISNETVNEPILDLEAEVIPVDLELHDCEIDGSIVLQRAEAKSIDLKGSKIEGLLAERPRISGDLCLFIRLSCEGTSSSHSGRYRRQPGCT